MTVEQTAQPAHSQKPESENDDYAKIKEVTNIDDYERIAEAIKACKNDSGGYEISDVISMLISEEPDTSASSAASPVMTVSQGVGTEGSTGSASPTATIIGPRNKPGTADVIDLTNDKENEEFQRAIAESLRDNQGILGGQISREEQEISRVLEQSLLEESKSGTKRKRGDLWFVDPLNPHERKRREEWPVGLKNVGNTCWFSAVIQSLFHLPIFRRLVLNFVPPPDISKGNNIEKRNLQFMHELRRLFALMIGSKRKYVDPSKAVEILKEAFTTGSGLTDSQQDVSEFQHKLLEWLEDAFRSDQSRPTSPTPGHEEGGSEEHMATNPMVQLFYGQYIAEGFNEGKKFSNHETFGQFPLRVDGYRDIHESLDAATAAGEIETLSSDVSLKSGQEQWFNRLPPVLTFELSRFQFNQALGRPEKIHNKLGFPEKIFMDRYMDCNKSITRTKREEGKKLREELVLLHAQLDKFINYGSGPKRVPLHDVLQYALEFAQSKSTTSSPGGGDNRGSHRHSHLQEMEMEMESPRSQSSMSVDSPSKSEAAALPEMASLSDTPMSPAMPHSPSLASPSPGTPLPAVSPTKLQPPIITPAPRYVAPHELQTLQTCLKRWRTEVESDVMELQGKISKRDETVSEMYQDPSLQKCPYQLHAVLVHEGQAASGHYWAYIYSSQYKTWLKFNDITVSEAQWEELQKESVGGYHNASAYCLMYVDSTQRDIIEEPIDKETGQSEMTLDNLPNDLQEFVKDDNDKFLKEIEEWDTEQKHKASKSETETQTQAPPPTTAGKSTAKLVLKPPLIVETHSLLSAEATYKLVTEAIESETFAKEGPKNALLQVCQKELTRVDAQVSQLPKSLPCQDHRLSHMVVFLRANQAPLDSVIKRVLLQQFAYLTNLNADDKFRQIQQVACQELELMTKLATPQMNKQYFQWHEDYYVFRNCALAFIKGAELFHRKTYAEGLPYLVHSCDMNQALIGERGELVMKAFNVKLLQYYRRLCLLNLNKMAVSQFRCEENIDEAFETMNTLVLPCLTVLSSATASAEDQGVVEAIRDEWCKILGGVWPGYKQEKLQDLLQQLLDPPGEVKQLRNLAIMKSLEVTIGCNTLYEQYQQVISTVISQGYLQAALGTGGVS